MKGHPLKSQSVLALLLATLLCLSGCAAGPGADRAGKAGTEAAVADSSRFLRIAGEELDTADPQCTGDYYNLPLNVFDRLVEVRVEADGSSGFAPSLADSWEISGDGLVYTFHLHEGVTFSNGSPFTASDVEYTLVRALTHPNSRMGDIGDFLLGADALRAGETDKLEGFNAISDLDFSLTLSTPYAALLAMLSVPGYSILDEETTRMAGIDFGKDRPRSPR